MVKKENNEEKDIADALEQITPFVEAVMPALSELQKAKEPMLKRNQYMNFIVMMTILIGIIILSSIKIIDGSAATGLIGTIIGYVFGSLYKIK